MNNKILMAVAAISASACARTVAHLSPAPGANTVGGIGQGATATAAGVQVTARSRAWQWDPTDLDTKVTPLLIELQNNGTSPALVRYNHVWLTDASGNRYNAMPPYDIDGSLSEAYTVRNPYYGFSRFSVAPYLGRWYPRFSRFNGAFAYDPAYYRPYFTEYARIALPTADMVQRALPEGVLSPGGHAEGFVYFEAFKRGAGALTLNVDIVDATSGSVIGTAHIPFVTS